MPSEVALVCFLVLLENGVIRRGHMENNLNNFYNK